MGSNKSNNSWFVESVAEESPRVNCGHTGLQNHSYWYEYR